MSVQDSPVLGKTFEFKKQFVSTVDLPTFPHSSRDDRPSEVNFPKLKCQRNRTHNGVTVNDRCVARFQKSAGTAHKGASKTCFSLSFAIYNNFDLA